jgi:hypothetical protein
MGHPFKSTLGTDGVRSAKSNLVLDIDQSTGMVNKDGPTTIASVLWLSPTSIGETTANRGLVMIHGHTGTGAKIIGSQNAIESRIINPGLIGTGTTLSLGQQTGLAQGGRTGGAGTDAGPETTRIFSGRVAKTSNSRRSGKIWNGLDNGALTIERL